MAEGTISQLLGTLDLIEGAGTGRPRGAPGLLGVGIGDVKPAGGGKSAVAQLLEHREVERQRQALAATIVLPPKPTTKPNPLLDQIGASFTEPPTYWKTPGASKQNAGVGAAISSGGGGGGGGPFVSKAKQKKREQGEKYKDRLTSKLSSRNNRKARLDHIKNVY